MKQIGRIELPGHTAPGGLDHAAVHSSSGKLFVAHTANDAVDVIDCAERRYISSIPGLRGVAGALVAEELGMLFTSNRGEDTVGMIALNDLQRVDKVPVGVRPNGLSVDPDRGLLLAANVGSPEIPGSHTLSVVDVGRRAMIHSIPVPGRTRWTIFDAGSRCFYINIARPFLIAVVEAAQLDRLARTIEIPAEGPHGLDFDASTGRLFCACDAAVLFAVEAGSGKVLRKAALSGAPDVIFFNAARKHLYVAIGDPGVLDVFDTDTLQRVETLSTAAGAHTIGFDAARNKVYVFEPGSHSAAVYMDEAV